MEQAKELLPPTHGQRAYQGESRVLESYPAWPGSHPTAATGQSPPSSSLAWSPKSIGSLSALGQLSPGLPPLAVWPQPAHGLDQVTSAVVLHSWPRSSYYKAWPPTAWPREGCPNLDWALG